MSEERIDDFLEALHRLGARCGGKAVLIAQARDLLGVSDDDILAAVEDAQQQGLIDTRRGMFTLPTMAGTRRIEERLTPRASSTHNNISIGTNINSPLQQAGTNSEQKQTISYDAAGINLLRDFVSDFVQHLSELNLSPPDERKASSQLATIEAQLNDDEPNPIIVQQAGKTLRNVTEGAIGSLIASGALALPWPHILALLRSFT